MSSYHAINDTYSNTKTIKPADTDDTDDTDTLAILIDSIVTDPSLKLQHLLECS